MKCKEKGCNGEIDNKKLKTLSFGCCGTLDTFPCNRCGRLHNKDGEVVNFEGGDRVFLIKGDIVTRM